MKSYQCLADLQSDLFSGKISCREVVNHHLNLIQENQDLNSFLEVFADESKELANQVDSNISHGKNGKLAYEIKTQAPYVPTMLARGDLMFLWYDKGIVTCIDAPTGAIHWRERVGGNFFGSPVLVDDKVYCISADGEVVVLKADKQFELLARNPLGEPSRATPAISGGRMYLRTYSHLISIGGKSL